MQQNLFTHTKTAVAYVDAQDWQVDLTRWQGDYQFSSLELPEQFGGEGDEPAYKVRLTPVHVHIGMHMHLMEIPADQVEQMIHLKYEWNESFLALRRLLLPSHSSCMAHTEVIYVEQVRQRADKSLVARMAPATLHFDGAGTEVIITENWYVLGLPLQALPKRAHHCHQRQLLGVLDSFDQDCRL